MMTMKQYRVGKDMTQEETAKELGVSLSMYRKYENMTAIPNIKFGYNFAKFFDADIQNIIFFKNQVTENVTSK